MSAGGQIELKKLYYLDHFHEMLDFVGAYNRALLNDTHFDFIDRFKGLDLADQCLYVRLTNRKGNVFRLDRVAYDEIPSPGDSISNLKSAGLFRDLSPKDLREYLGCLLRPELVSLVRCLPGQTPGKASAKKSELIELIHSAHEFEEIAALPDFPEAVALGRSIELRYLLFLYFGRLEESLGAFTLRDLGIMKTRRHQGGFQARFPSRDLALAAFHYRNVRAEINGADSESLKALASEVSEWPLVEDPEILASRHRAIYKLGRALERDQATELALPVYLVSDHFPSTERAVRILFQTGADDAAKEKLRELIDNPSCDEELIFAEDFYERKFGERRVGKLTSLLRNSRVLPLDEAGREYPEAAAASYLARSGAKAHHVENSIWTQLFGVVFWDALFEDEMAAVHSNFDRLPAGLNSDRFYRENEEFVERQLDLLKTPGWAGRQIEKVMAAMDSTPNQLLLPRPEWFELARQVVDWAPQGAVQIVLRELAKNFRGNRSGFPDLIVFENGTVRFIEIKAPGDQIQRHQLAQFERLRRAGFCVEVARIEWTVDPDREYVVVDVETTGGNPAWNRVTEIGAVKVRGGKIVDEFSTLINPGRRIPRNIVQLTGITDEMVANAPVFAGVADPFRDFLGDAIFVGHRVKFDYGFIRGEFRRIEREFRAATFCTVVETKRYFPGLKSYGLANLCREFEISLDSHHRALCDAKATAELLFRINRRREQLFAERIK